MIEEQNGRDNAETASQQPSDQTSNPVRATDDAQEPIRGREFDVNSINVGTEAPVIRETRASVKGDVWNDPSFLSSEDVEEDRSRFTIFFQVLQRKFWRLINLNLLAGIFNLPALAFMLILSMYLLQVLSPNVLTENSNDAVSYLFIVFLPILMTFLSVPAVTMGPGQAGLSYILRNWSYETPTFLWWDYKEKMRENFKQGMAVGTINAVVFILALLDFYLYSRLANGSLLLTAASSLLFLLFVIFLMMCMYLWPMMVSYQLSIKQLYRNAFLFAIGRFFPNLLFLVLMLALSYGPFLIAGAFGSVLAYLIAYVYHALLGLTLPALVMHFFVNPILDKHMQPQKDDESAE